MAGSSYTALEAQYGELSGVVASQWGEDAMATVDDKLHMTDDTNIQTVQGPLNFSTTAVNTFAGPMNFSTTGVSTWAGPINFTTAATHTWAGPVDFNSSGNMQGAMTFQTHIYFANNTTYYINQVGSPNFNQMTVANAATFDGALDFNSTMNLEGIATFQTGISVGGIATFSSQIGGSTLTMSSTATFGGAIDANSTANFQGDITVQANIIASGATWHRINMDGATNNIYIHPGDDSVDAYLKLWSDGATSINLVPSQSGIGSLGTSGGAWNNVYSTGVYTENLRSMQDSEHWIDLDAGADIMSIHPGDVDTDRHIQLQSIDNTQNSPRINPSVTDSGYLGHPSFNYWHWMYSYYFYYKSAPAAFDEYDDLADLDAMEFEIEDSGPRKGKGKKDNTGHVRYKKESIPSYLKVAPDPKDNDEPWYDISTMASFGLGCVKQLHGKHKNLEGSMLDAIQELRDRITTLESN